MRSKHKADLDDVDEFYEMLMRGELLPGDDQYEAGCNTIVNEMTRLGAGDSASDVVKGMRLAPQLKTAVIRMVYHGRDPSSVPYRHIRHALDNPSTITVFDRKDKGEWKTLTLEYESVEAQRKSIKGPLRAIRIKCFECMGGQIVLIRSCATINCHLWSFRLGTNPFYGRLVGSDGEEEATQSDDEIEKLEELFEEAQAKRFANLTPGDEA
jgi:hypothetical protein